jgi:hypothetical protein
VFHFAVQMAPAGTGSSACEAAASCDAYVDAARSAVGKTVESLILDVVCR